MTDELKEALDAFEEACWTSPSEAPAMRHRIETIFGKLEARYGETRDSRNALIRQLGGCSSIAPLEDHGGNQ